MVDAHAHPHFHQVPRYYGVGGLVLYKFSNELDEYAAFRYSAAHSALIYDEKFFGDIGTVDLRNQEFGAIITHIYPQTVNAYPIYDLSVITPFGSFNVEGACNENENEASCYCALGCRLALDPICSQPNFCSPTPVSPPPVLPCPNVGDARCRWYQAKIGKWKALPTRYASDAIEGEGIVGITADWAEILGKPSYFPTNWLQIEGKPNFVELYASITHEHDQVYRRLDVAIDYRQLSNHPDRFTPSSHAATHGAGRPDAITPQMIGADPLGAASTAFSIHISAADPHSQYRRKQVAIKWDEISGVPPLVTDWNSIGGKPEFDSLYRSNSIAIDWSDLDGIPIFATRWPLFSEVENKPTNYPPSNHAETHAAGQPDAITPAAIGACELTGGLVPINRLPPLSITDRFSASSNVEMTDLAAQIGDICYRSDQGRYYQKVNTEGLLTDWIAWLEPPVLSVNGLNGDVVLTPAIIGARAVSATIPWTEVDAPLDFNPSPHAATHHLDGGDAISAEAIGAEAVGVAQGLIITHLSQSNPHPQYRPRNEGIPWEQIVNAPSSANPPALNFVPFSSAEWTLITGILPSSVTIADPPVGNEGVPCYEFQAGTRAYLNPWYQLPSGITEAYRITLFARSFAANYMTVTAGFYRINTIGSAVDGPSIVLGLSPEWQQYDVHITNLNSTNASLVTLYCFCSGSANQVGQVYGPQFSVAL